MGIARGENAIGLRKTRIFMDREEDLRNCLVEASAEEMCNADYERCPAGSGARAETQRRFDMPDREIRFPADQPQHAADVPAARKARVERQRTIGQCRHRADVLAEKREREGGIREDARIVVGLLQCLARQSGSLAAVGLRIFALAVVAAQKPANRCPSERGRHNRDRAQWPHRENRSLPELVSPAT